MKKLHVALVDDNYIATMQQKSFVPGQIPETCPFCTAQRGRTDWMLVNYDCGTSIFQSALHRSQNPKEWRGAQSNHCTIKERDLLFDRMAAINDLAAWAAAHRIGTAFYTNFEKPEEQAKSYFPGTNKTATGKTIHEALQNLRNLLNQETPAKATPSQITD